MTDREKILIALREKPVRYHGEFPLGTFLINVSGSFIIGYLSFIPDLLSWEADIAADQYSRIQALSSPEWSGVELFRRHRRIGESSHVL